MEKNLDKKIRLRYFISSKDSAFDSQVKALLQKYKTNQEISEAQLIDISETNIINIIKDAIKNRNKVDICHARGENAAFYAYIYSAITESKLVVDIRGAKYEEIDCFDSFILKRYLKKGLLRLLFSLLKNSATFSCVSESLRDYLCEKYSIDREIISLNHCIAGDGFVFDKAKRKEIRDQLKVNEEELLFVMINGGNSPWQNIDDILEKVDDGRSKLLLISKNEFCKKNDNVIWKKLKHEEVAHYLSAADVGMVFREENIVNKVACPIKFVEYISCGLPIITSGNVDFIREFILKYKCGVILNINNMPEKIDIEVFNREKISMDGKKMFSINRISEDYLRLYRDVIS